jgi:hypothetical protein
MHFDTREPFEAFEVVNAAYHDLESRVAELRRVFAPHDPRIEQLLNAWSQVCAAESEGLLFELEDALNTAGRVVEELLRSGITRN